MAKLLLFSIMWIIMLFIIVMSAFAFENNQIEDGFIAQSSNETDDLRYYVDDILDETGQGCLGFYECSFPGLTFTGTPAGPTREEPITAPEYEKVLKVLPWFLAPLLIISFIIFLAWREEKKKKRKGWFLIGDEDEEEKKKKN